MDYAGIEKKISLLWPFAFVPATLYAAKAFGHLAATVLLSALFFFLFVRRADVKTRRLMIVLAVFSAVFETANVGVGAYKYSGTIATPVWISIGWGILGWWLASLEKEFAKIGFKTAFAAICVMLVAFPFYNNTLSASSAIAIAGLYMLSLCVSQPFSIYAFTALFGMIAEYAGTAVGVWTYYSAAGSGIPVQPDLAFLALAYSLILAFCFWTSGFEGKIDRKRR
ncbi:MAG: hypothetical protein QXR53_02130 [Candidatus Norongarragalinales archaeon]